jgi:hypothetical protein
MSDSNSAFLTLLSGFKNLAIRFWPSLVMFVCLVTAARYLDNWAAFMLSITFWVIHCQLIDNESFSRNE